MFKKHIIFQILYIIVGLLCSASLKHIVFYKAPPSDKHSLLWLASWPRELRLAKHHKHASEMWCQNLYPLPKSQASAFKINVKTVNNVFSFTITSSPKEEQSFVTDTVMMLRCICSTQAVFKKADSTVMWLCLSRSREIHACFLYVNILAALRKYFHIVM